ncbi:MAG: tyrosine-type recombinase/integrase [Microbacterium ginsengisoli]|jgi:integrase/recombinase XerD|nr:tyrosine-type recombinase/integrase [Microbacterium ginsengisoli]
MLTWDTVLAHWAAHQRAAGLADRTIEGREAVLRMLAARSGREPRQIETIDLLELLGRPHARTGRQLAPRSKQVERSYLQTWGKWMVAEGYLAFDPTARLPKTKVPRRRPRPLRLEHIEILLESGAYRRTREMITIAALTGLRIGEIVKIRGEDVDFIAGTIRSIRKGGLDHVVFMQADVRAIAESKPRTGWWFPSPYANRQFPDGDGHVLMKSASSGISRLLRRCGITDPNITGHSLRHFYATMLLRRGVGIRVVQEMLGHASLATTQLYIEVTDDEMAEGSNALPRISPRDSSGRSSGRLAA